MIDQPQIKLFIESSERLFSSDWTESCFSDWDRSHVHRDLDTALFFEDQIDNEKIGNLSFSDLPNKLLNQLVIRQEEFGGLIYNPQNGLIFQMNDAACKISHIWQKGGKQSVFNELISSGYSEQDAKTWMVSYSNQVLSSIGG